MPKILVSNDDGINARGINVLAARLAKDCDVAVVAPDRDHSGASGSLTLSRPLRVTTLENGYHCIDGTPADSAHIGIASLYSGDVERVISGINSHENLGDDVLYSGTVAAALEGRFLDKNAIAVSLVNAGNDYYETAAEVVSRLLTRLDDFHLGAHTVLNVNIPDVAFDELKGFQVTKLGHRAKGGAPESHLDPRGRERLWIATAGEGEHAGPGTDFYAVANGYVSITPIQADMTNYQAVNAMEEWLANDKKNEKF